MPVKSIPCRRDRGPLTAPGSRVDGQTCPTRRDHSLAKKRTGSPVDSEDSSTLASSVLQAPPNRHCPRGQNARHEDYSRPLGRPQLSPQPYHAVILIFGGPQGKEMEESCCLVTSPPATRRRPAR